MGEDPIPAGTTVLQGIVYPYLKGNPHWFQRGKQDGKHKPKPEVFLLQHVAKGKVGVTHGEIGRNMPTKNKSGITPWAKMQPRDFIRIYEPGFQEIQREIQDRNQLDLIAWGVEDDVEELANQLEHAAVDDSEVESESESEDEDEKENDQPWIPKTPRNKFITPLKKRPRRGN